jgi:hypothetical protein
MGIRNFNLQRYQVRKRGKIGFVSIFRQNIGGASPPPLAPPKLFMPMAPLTGGIYSYDILCQCTHAHARARAPRGVLCSITV